MTGSRTNTTSSASMVLKPEVLLERLEESRRTYKLNLGYVKSQNLRSLYMRGSSLNAMQIVLITLPFSLVCMCAHMKQ